MFSKKDQKPLNKNLKLNSNIELASLYSSLSNSNFHHHHHQQQQQQQQQKHLHDQKLTKTPR